MGAEAGVPELWRARLFAAVASVATVVGLVLMAAGDGVAADIGRVVTLVAAPIAGLQAWRGLPGNGRQAASGPEGSESSGGTQQPTASGASGAVAKPPRTTKAGQSGAERWWFRLAVAAALGTVMLLFWSWTSAMTESSCRDTPVEGVPGCAGEGPASRVLLGWSVLVAAVFAFGLAARRWSRRRRLVRAGWDFVRMNGARADRGRVMVRLAVVLWWTMAPVALLAIWAPDSAGGTFAIGALAYLVVASVIAPIGHRQSRS